MVSQCFSKDSERHFKYSGLYVGRIDLQQKVRFFFRATKPLKNHEPMPKMPSLELVILIIRLYCLFRYYLTSW